MMEPQRNIQPIANGVTRLELPARTLPPFTHINSYVVANQGRAILIDPGFYEMESLGVVTDALQGNTLTAIVLTHTHPDHIEGIALVRERYPDLPIYVHELELNKVVQHNNVKPLDPVKPFYVSRLELYPVFTPGHSPGHLSFYLPSEKLAIVGDMVAGFGSIWIGTPEGNINDYFESLEKLKLLNTSILAPGHGEVIYHVSEKFEEVKQHRLQRLEQVRAALTGKPLTLGELRQLVYPDIDPRIEILGEQSLLALLEFLEEDKLITHQGEKWRLLDTGEHA